MLKNILGNSKIQVRSIFGKPKQPEICKYVVYRIDSEHSTNGISSPLGEYYDKEVALSKLKTLEQHSENRCTGTKHKLEKVCQPKIFKWIFKIESK